jgi:hypothetical protein
MKRTGFLLFAFIAAISACGSSERTASVASNSDPKIQFGVFDISTGPGAQPAAEKSAANAANTAASTASAPEPHDAKPGRSSTSRPASLNQSEQNRQSSLAFDRKIIRNAELDLETDLPEEAQQSITSIAESKGGFVVESQQSSSDIKSATRDIVTMSVRVPAERFGETLLEVRKTAKRVVIETVKGQDVTDEFIDIEAQLKAKKALEAQFMEIMKRANTVEDALDVQSQLADVRGEIERIEGRKRFLENQSSLSTIKIRLQTPKAFAATSEGFSDRLSESFLTGFDVAMNFVLGLLTLVIALIPAALLIGLPAFAIFRYLWKRQTRPISVAEIAEEEIRNG